DGAAIAGIGGQPARLLAATGPGVVGVGRIPILRRDLAERLACLLGGAARRARSRGSATGAEQLGDGVTLVLGQLVELLAHLGNRLALVQRGLALLGLADERLELF